MNTREAVGRLQLAGSMRVVDSHTEGEPTRVVIDGWPQPAGRGMPERRNFLAANQDDLRRAVVLEPRGHAAVVGALLTPPVETGSDVGVIFFNNVGCLGMCGHGLMGVAATMRHLGRLAGDSLRADTAVGTVTARLLHGGEIEIENVESYCYRRDVSVHVPEVGQVTGDIAYGGNWFFITELPALSLRLENARELLAVTNRIMTALEASGIKGAGGATIDHVELHGEPTLPGAGSRNFVLCPGGEFDRSPCGTGTSARIAALHSRGLLKPGEVYLQESITGSSFAATLVERAGKLIPVLRGRAFITAESVLHFDPADPFLMGLPLQ